MDQVIRRKFKLFTLKLLTLIIVISLFTSANADTSTPTSNNGKPPLTLGYFPLITTVALFKRFAPLRDYLSSALERPVILETAKDFPTFVQRTDERKYDIVVTAPHFTVRAADSGKYVVRATLTSDVQQLIVVREDSTIKSLSDLAGQKVATPPRSALITMMGMQYLSDAGLNQDNIPTYITFKSHNAANEAVIGNEAVAAIASSNIIKKALEQGQPLRVFSKGLQLPNMATLVASDLNDTIGNQIVAALVNMNNTEQGRQVLRQISFPGYRAIEAKEYEPARPYMERAGNNSQAENH